MKNFIMRLSMLVVCVLGTLTVIDAYSMDGGAADTPDIITAAEAGNVRTVAEYIDKGFDINAVDQTGWTALMAAAFGGHDEVVRMLLAAPDIDVNATDTHGDTALILATGENYGEDHIKIVRMLLDAPGINVNAINKYGDTALIIAAMYGSVNLLTTLLAAGARADIVNKDGMTALMLASKNGRTEIVQTLLEAEMDPTMPFGAAADHLNPNLALTQDDKFEQVCEQRHDDRAKA